MDRPGNRRPRDRDLGAEADNVDALITDRYLESILTAHARSADAGPTPASERPSTDVRLVSDWLARGLPRLHPSFRFEEALAAKLTAAAARMRLALVRRQRRWRGVAPGSSFH